MAQLIKTFRDLAIASVKTIGDVPIASIKSVRDVDNTAGGGGGTDWTADATLKGLYLFNSSPGINQDSSGKGNHIDDATAAEAPAASTGDKIEGDQAADFETSGNDDGLILSYANASVDFPCNGTGDGEVTFAGWVKAESIANPGYIAGISSGNVFRFTCVTGGTLVINFDGSSTATHTSTATIATGTWYFVAAVYSDAANEIRLYIRQQGAGSSTWETTAANIGTLDDASASSFSIGCRLDNISANCWDGLIDALAVFNGKAFTQAELDGVFTNGWDGNGW
jgi:hypothetical protein